MRYDIQQSRTVWIVLRLCLLLAFGTNGISRAVAVCLPTGPCGAGAYCRCTNNAYTDLTSVTLPLDHPYYLLNRLLEMAVNQGPAWREGDILFLGDSLTDFGRLDFDPLVPRSLNTGILGIQIDQVIHVLDLFEMYLPSPSKVVVLIGSNDIRSSGHPQFNSAKFQRLMDRLQTFKIRHGAEIVVRSIPPGEPDVTGDLPPDMNRLAYNVAVLQANHFLKTKSADQAYGFVFFDDYSVYLKPGENELAYNLFAGSRYSPCVPMDNLHIGCNGYIFSIANMSDVLFPEFPGTTGVVDNLPPRPDAPPRDGIPDAAGKTFRYVHHTLPPGTSATFTVDGSSYNYVSVFDPYTRFFNPGFDHGQPSAESIKPDGQVASVRVSNTVGIPQTIVVCVGAGEGGKWHVSTD